MPPSEGASDASVPVAPSDPVGADPADDGDRRFDGTRWWAWDGGSWVLVPDWPAPASTAPGEAPAPRRRSSVVGLLVVAALLIVAVAGVVWLTRTPAPDFHDMSALAADLQRRGNDSAAAGKLTTTLTSVACTPAATPSTATCTASVSDGSTFPIAVTIAPDGQSYSTG